MTQNALFEQPFDSLDGLFLDYQWVTPNYDRRGHPYPPNDGYFFLGGLPGSIDIRNGRALRAKPSLAVLDRVLPRCCNRALGSFRAVRSAYWMKQGLLPVWADDAHHIAHILVGFVPYSEHERFAA